jgi:hypothetical protein
LATDDEAVVSSSRCQRAALKKERIVTEAQLRNQQVEVRLLRCAAATLIHFESGD